MDLNSLFGTVLNARVLLRSLIFEGTLPSLGNKLLRVLAPFDRYLNISYTLLLEVLNRLVKTRYLEFSLSNSDGFYYLPSSICLLWNLQCLTIRDFRCIMAPPEIWKMPQLRLINIEYLIIPHPPSESNDIIMENLQSARSIVNFNFCEEVVKRISNIKKLAVSYNDCYEGFDEALHTLNNVDHLQKLKSFEFCIITLKNVAQSYYDLFRNVTFPYSLKKLSFQELQWDDVTTKIGSLPLLEVLDLIECRGHEWELVEGQFVKLKFLRLFMCRSIRRFTANNHHFPCLQCLILWKLDRLEGISSEIGDISTLNSIELNYCPDEAVISAKEIAVEQRNLGNEELRVRATLVKESSLSESISTCNFHIKLDDFSCVL